MDNKTISSQTINDAVSMLGALLNVREFFTRIAADIEVYDSMLVRQMIGLKISVTINYKVSLILQNL